MAHYQKLQEGKYRLFAEEKKEGKRKRRTKVVCCQTDVEAEYELRRYQRHLDTGINLDPQSVTLDDFSHFWRKNCTDRLESSTLRVYLHTLDSHILPRLGHVKLKDFMPAHLLQYQNDLLKSGAKKREGGLSANTVRKHNALLRTIFNDAVTLDFLLTNPAKAIRPPKISREKKFRNLTPDEVVRLLAACEGTTLNHIIFLGVKTGMRVSELLGLEWKNVDFDRGIIEVRQKLDSGTMTLIEKLKTSSSRRDIPISRKIEKRLRKIKGEQAQYRLLLGDDYYSVTNTVISKDCGEPYSPYVASEQFLNLRRRLGIEGVRLLDLRHTFGTLSRKAGEDINRIKELMGHSTVSTTYDYYDHSDDHERRQVMDRIDSII